MVMTSMTIFAGAMIALGIAALFLTEEIVSCVLKIIGRKKGLLRFGGVIALVMAFFFLWVIWQNIR